MPHVRTIGEPLTRRPWSEDDKRAAEELKASGLSPSAIAEKLGRTPAAIRGVFCRAANHVTFKKTLADREAGLTHKRCRKCGVDKPLDAFTVTVTGQDRAEYRWPYCKPCEIERMADRRERGLHLEKTRRHVAKNRAKYPEKNAARRAFNLAVRSGKIIRSEVCEMCKRTPPRNRVGSSTVHAHHDDYSKPFEVRWLCQPCHNRYHRENPNVPE